MAITNQKGQRSSPSDTGKPGTHVQMQRPHMTSPATKHDEAENMEFCRYLSVYQVCNAFLIIKASKVHHHAESLEALKRAEKGADNTPVRHHGPRVQ